MSKNAKVWTALVTVYIIWGSTYLGIAYAGETIPPLFAASTRFITAGTLMQFASARPFNATTGIDKNGDASNNDRPVVNGAVLQATGRTYRVPVAPRSVESWQGARGIRLLLAGDQERPSQAELRRTYPDLHVDVLKVAHHGSSKQDADLVTSLGARLAVISVGLDNDYGHPAPSTLDLLRRAGMLVRRTDLDGDVAVTVDEHGRLGTVTRPSRP